MPAVIELDLAKVLKVGIDGQRILTFVMVVVVGQRRPVFGGEVWKGRTNVLLICHSEQFTRNCSSRTSDISAPEGKGGRMLLIHVEESHRRAVKKEPQLRVGSERKMV